MGLRLTEPSLKVLKVFLDDPRASYCGADLVRAIGLAAGTLYPILMRFEKAGVLHSAWESKTPQDLGRPRRRFYTITGHGRRVAREAFGALGVPKRRVNRQ